MSRSCIVQLCGTGGTFTHVSENVMQVLRNNKDSLLAVLEAFVHDPLLNWSDRLIVAPDVSRSPVVSACDLGQVPPEEDDVRTVGQKPALEVTYVGSMIRSTSSFLMPQLAACLFLGHCVVW